MRFVVTGLLVALLAAPLSAGVLETSKLARRACATRSATR
jgi:hypothetical protein